MKTHIGCVAILLIFCHAINAQVDTSFIYRTNTAFGTLDLRIAKSATRYYYLQENKTFSFRESSPGVRSENYRDMTSWDSSPYSQGNLREKNGSQDYFIMNYRLLFPKNYQSTIAQGYPLIVMLHGAGERGNCWDNSCYWDTRSWRPLNNNPAAPTSPNHELLNNDHNLLHGGSIHLDARNLAGNRLPDDPTLPSRAFPGFVLFPQNLNGWDGNTSQDAIRIVRLLLKKYNIDPDRIYVHGLSNGGISTYEVIKRAPWLFAAALPMSAPTESAIISKGLVPTISHIPLWIFQGGLDTAPTPGRTRGYVKSFRDGGSVVRYNEYPHLGHGVWNAAYEEPDFFSWMLSKNKSNIHLFAGVSSICESNGRGVRMELAEGFFHYEWQRNGATITDATGPRYEATEPGTYRARFSRKPNPGPADWNQWSDPVEVTTQNIQKPDISQKGTVVLKGLDNYGYAQLKAEGNFTYYYWYKDGVLINLPGSQDDTTRHVKLASGDCSSGPCKGNGVYTLVVAGPDFCTSPPSDGKYIFFNNQAPINITAPANFSGSALPDGKALLSWTDNSADENGFEIWRRRQTGPTTYSTWEMAPLVVANSVSVVDYGLMPSTTYQYKIRAVGNAGRSNYTPSANNQYLVITTSADTEKPTVPANLQASAPRIGEITLQWEPSSDNTRVSEYVIEYGSQILSTGSSSNTYTFAELPLNTQYTFTVRAKDVAGNLSAPSNPANASTYWEGLYYEHTTGSYTDLDLIDWNVAEFSGRVTNFSLAPRTQEDYFNFRFTGFLFVEKQGYYQFQTISDDGSRASIDHNMIVDNDGLHGAQTVTSQSIWLNSGARYFEVLYFEQAGEQTLTVRYKGPDTGNSWRDIPANALRSGNSSALTTQYADNQTEQPPLPEDGDDLIAELYPNPVHTNQLLTLQLGGVEKPVQVELVNLFGKRYFHDVIHPGENRDLKIEPREQLVQGMYVLKIRRGNKVRHLTLVVKD